MSNLMLCLLAQQQYKDTKEIPYFQAIYGISLFYFLFNIPQVFVFAGYEIFTVGSEQFKINFFT
jgi:hypothetical protein